jgi:hypothetical protein
MRIPNADPLHEEEGKKENSQVCRVAIVGGLLSCKACGFSRVFIACSGITMNEKQIYGKFSLQKINRI